MRILEMLLDSKMRVFGGIESIMSILCRAALTMSVESRVLIMEHHSSKRGPLSENSMVEEVVMAINGPEVVHCDAVVGETIRVLTKSDNVHFVRRSDSVKPWIVSKSVDNLRKSLSDLM